MICPSLTVLLLWHCVMGYFSLSVIVDSFCMGNFSIHLCCGGLLLGHFPNNWSYCVKIVENKKVAL